MLEVQARAVRSLLELVQLHRGNALAIVSHADVIRGTIGHVLGIPVDNLLRISIEPASVSTIAFAARGRSCSASTLRAERRLNRRPNHRPNACRTAPGSARILHPAIVVTTTTMGRRAFLRLAAAAGLPVIVPLHRAVARTAHAAVALRVGVVLPQADPAAAGAGLGAREAAQAARLFRSEFAVHERPADSAAAAAAAAEDLAAGQAVHAIIGGGTPAASDAVQRLTEHHGVLFLNVGCAPESLAEPCGALTFHVIPGDAMRADAMASVPDAPPGSRALAWHPSLARFGAGQVNDRFTAAYARPMTERAWTGWMAMKILFDAAQRGGTSEAARLAVHLTSARALFDGHKGLQLSFRPVSHQLRQPLYIVAGDDVLAEVPAARAPAGMTHAEWLDTIGLSGGDRCDG